MMRDIAHVTAMVLLTVVLSMGLSPLDMWAEEAGTGGVPEPTQVPVPTTPASTPETSAPSGPSAPQSSASPEPASPPVPKEHPFVSLTGLVMQPPYLAIRVGVALMGAMTSGVVWVIPGENNRQNAQAVWDKTVRNNWGWPEFVQAVSAPSGKKP